LKHNASLLGFTKPKRRKTIPIKDVLLELSKFKEIKMFVYPTVPDIIASSVITSKLLSRDIRVAVKAKPLITMDDIKNEVVLTLGLPLNESTVRTLNKYAKGGYLIGLCDHKLKTREKELPFLKCINHETPLAIIVWQMLKETYDYLDYMLTLSSIIAHNFFRYPKLMSEEIFLNECVSKDILDKIKGLRIAGANHKPIVEVLTHSLIPFLFGITGSYVEAEKFLRDHGIHDLRTKLIEHDPVKIKEIVKDLLNIINKVKEDAWKIEDLIGDTYGLKKKVSETISDSLELSLVLDVIVETYGMEKSVFMKEHFSPLIKIYEPEYFATIRKLSRTVDVLVKEGLKEMEVENRVLKILHLERPDTAPYYVLESILVTSGLIEKDDLIAIECGKKLLIPYSSIRRVFGEQLLRVLEKFIEKAYEKKVYGLTFKSIKNIIECLRAL